MLSIALMLGLLYNYFERGSKDSLLKDANKQRKRWPIKNIRTRKAPAGLYRVLSGKWMDSKYRTPQSIICYYSVLASYHFFLKLTVSYLCYWLWLGNPARPWPFFFLMDWIKKIHTRDPFAKVETEKRMILPDTSKRILTVGFWCQAIHNPTSPFRVTS